MLSRRCRIQARPNLSGLSKVAKTAAKASVAGPKESVIANELSKSLSKNALTVSGLPKNDLLNDSVSQTNVLVSQEGATDLLVSKENAEQNASLLNASTVVSQELAETSALTPSEATLTKLPSVSTLLPSSESNALTSDVSSVAETSGILSDAQTSGMSLDSQGPSFVLPPASSEKISADTSIEFKRPFLPNSANAECDKTSTEALKTPKFSSSVKSTGISEVHHCDSSLRRRTRTISTVSYGSVTTTCYNSPKKMRKKFTGQEPLDPKKMTMQDLIYWNPKNETRLQGDRKAKRKDNIISDLSKNSESAPKEVQQQKPVVAAPQVKIAEDGTLIIDESSLTISNENDSSTWELVTEDRLNRKINSRSFRKRPINRGPPWSDLETDYFYDILRATGPDFTFMHHFFPMRTRPELKSKYNREERNNWERLNEALRTPSLLSESLGTYAEMMVDKIKEDNLKRKIEKITKKSKKKRNGKDEVVEEEWLEETADLEAEAEQEILRLQAEESEQSSSQSTRRKQKKDAEETSLKEQLLRDTAAQAAKIIEEKKRKKWRQELMKTCEDILRSLSDDFPKFDICIDENVSVVSVEASSDGVLPLVRIPTGTILRVLPADPLEPERLLLDCPAEKGDQSRQFVIKHQLSPQLPSSGFLHLFAVS